MDDCRFDNFARIMAKESDRRSTVKKLAGGAAALALLARAELGLAEGDVTLEANCKGTNGKCRKNKDCCSKKCTNKGKCVCAGAKAPCKRDNGCCSGTCKGNKCECGDKGDRCNNNSDCCSKNCRKGKCKCIRGGDRCGDNKECCSNRCSGGFCTNSL